MQRCNCVGACRCENNHELCLFYGKIKRYQIVCPTDETGCPLQPSDVVTATMSFLCRCCDHVLYSTDVEITVDPCNGCFVTVDLVAVLELVGLQNRSQPKYMILVNDMPQSAGVARIDWTFLNVAALV